MVFHGNLEKMRRAAFTSAWISRTQPLKVTPYLGPVYYSATGI